MAKYYVDSAMLVRRGACACAVSRFRRVFGDGPVMLTLGNVEKALSAGLPVAWPATQPFWRTPRGSALELKAARLQGEAWDAGDAPSLLRVLLKAPKLWAQIDSAEARA